MPDHSKKFPGFPPEPVTNYWPYPKALNGWWHALTAWEQKVLDYLLRHTWGYKKDADSISLSQFMNGIVKKNGDVLDTGTGIKDKRTVRKALNGLMEKGFINCIPVSGRESIFELKINPSHGMLPLTSHVTTHITKDEMSNPSHVMSPTIKNITINNNIGNQTYKKDISDVISYLENKLGGVRFANYPKQAKAVKAMLTANYTVKEIIYAIDKMYSNQWWREKSFDMKNVADQISKIMARNKQTEKEITKPKYTACNKNGCENGYIKNIVSGSYKKCACIIEYNKNLEMWENNWNSR